jgi:NADH dehydrogenase
MLSIRGWVMKHRIVIVGGGAGGIELATRLGKTLGRRSHAMITLVDANLTHIWKPLFHEVAAGSLNPGVDELNYIAQANWNSFHFQHGRMTGLDRSRKVIRLTAPNSSSSQERELAYDTLVMAVGSHCNDFGTPGVQQHCQFLDSRAQAERLHGMLLNRYMRSHATDTAHPLEIAIVGAGATGVELCAELQHAVRVIKGYGVKHACPSILNITLLEAGPRILPVLNERASQAVQEGLMQLGISVRVGTAVKEVTDSGVVLANGETLAADLKIWAAGIKAPDFLSTLDGLETNRINQLNVKRTLQTTQDDSIFALGDCSSCPLDDESGRFVPPRAQAANQQAALLCKNLARHLDGESLLQFKYEDKGTLISLASFDAVGSLNGIFGGKGVTQGLVAKTLYTSLYRLHQAALYGTSRMLLRTVAEYLQRKTRPRLRLH